MASNNPKIFKAPYDEDDLVAVWASEERQWLIDQLYVLYDAFHRAFGPTSPTAWTVEGWPREEWCANELAEQVNLENKTLGFLLPQLEGWYYSPERLVPERLPFHNHACARISNVQPAPPVRPVEWGETTSWKDSDLFSKFSPEVQINLSRCLKEMDEQIICETICHQVRQYAATILDAGVQQAAEAIRDVERQYSEESTELTHESDSTLRRLRLLRLRLNWLTRWKKEDAKYQRIFKRSRIQKAERVVSPRAVAKAEEAILDLLLAKTHEAWHDDLRNRAVLDVASDERRKSELEDNTIGLIILGRWYRNALRLCGLLPDDLKQIEARNAKSGGNFALLQDGYRDLGSNTHLVQDKLWAVIARRKAGRL